MTGTSVRFPWWIPLGAAVVALGYLPTLTTPFDFVDDGNLVYPAPAGTSWRGHIDLWWGNVVSNVEHLGPFRPTLWAHWHVQANVFGGDPLLWRAWRLIWCGLAAGMLLWLLRELRIPAAAALFATAAALWNPYRSEIWTSLTLSEGVAMPYALFALVAARKAASANRSWIWDAAGFLCVLVALGCKNTFAALVPAQMVLRMWPDDLSLREAWRRHGLRAVGFVSALALPVGHFIYFKLNWHAGQYQPHSPSLAQLGRVLSALKGGMGLDFLGAGTALAIVVVARGSALVREYRAAVGCGTVLALAGAFVYLPMDGMSGRYTMPAAWGLDVLFAVLLTALIRVPGGWGRTVAGLALCAGLGAVFVVNLHRQEKFAARARMLWRVVHHLEERAPHGAAVAWISGNTARGELGVEEGIHLQWHLINCARADVRIALLDGDEQPIARPELPPQVGEAAFRVAASGAADARVWEFDRAFTTVYQFGRKRYDCHVSHRLPAGVALTPAGR
jgi:hypothetical protein